MKYIVMVVPSFYPVVGGAERQASQLSHYLTGLGVNVLVFTRSVSGAVSKEEVSGFTVRRLKSFFPKVGFALSVFGSLLKMRKSLGVIHVHSMSGQALAGPIMINFFSNIPLIVKVTRSGHGTPLERYNRNIFGRFFFRIVRACTSKFIALTDEVMSELLESGVPKDKIACLPNGVESGSLKSCTNTDSIRLIVVSRLIKRKRVSLLIKACKSLREKYKIEVCIVGDGPERRVLENEVTGLGLREEIYFRGSLSPLEVESCLSESDIFVLPSASEGMSNALLEAMGKGLCVIAEDMPANASLVKSGYNGILCHMESSLTETLSSLLDHPARIQEYGDNAYLTIKENYEFQKIAKDYLNLYRNEGFDTKRIC